jgi:hypothetical protein
MFDGTMVSITTDPGATPLRPATLWYAVFHNVDASLASARSTVDILRGEVGEYPPVPRRRRRGPGRLVRTGDAVLRTSPRPG